MNFNNYLNNVSKALEYGNDKIPVIPSYKIFEYLLKFPTSEIGGWKVSYKNNTLGGIFLYRGYYCHPSTERAEYEEISNIWMPERYVGRLWIKETENDFGDLRYGLYTEIQTEENKEDYLLSPLRYYNSKLERLNSAFTKIKYRFYVYSYDYEMSRLRDGSYSYSFVKLISAKTLAEMLLGIKGWHLGFTK